jgi:hypothetical protein
MHGSDCTPTRKGLATPSHGTSARENRVLIALRTDRLHHAVGPEKAALATIKAIDAR